MNMDFGLAVTFDGKGYTLLSPGHVKEYPVGGLICEYCRLAPTAIKEVILACSNLDTPVTAESATAITLGFHEKLYEAFPPVTATMISLEFQNNTFDWITAIREDRLDELTQGHYIVNEQDAIQQFIFEGTPYKSFGCETLLQMMLSNYFSFALTYVNTKYMFMHIFDEKEGQQDQRENVYSACSQFYGDMMDMQHIDFRIVAMENDLQHMYTIKSSLSLILFEVANCIQNEQQLVKCANCGHFFVPEGRSDIIYCSYTSPQNRDKTCREIGAQVARANKEKNDVVTKEYRRAYMRHQMMTKRHPHDKVKRQQFDALTAGMREWRIKLADGSATADDFLAWLEQFK